MLAGGFAEFLNRTVSSTVLSTERLKRLILDFMQATNTIRRFKLEKEIDTFLDCIKSIGIVSADIKTKQQTRNTTRTIEI